MGSLQLCTVCTFILQSLQQFGMQAFFCIINYNFDSGDISFVELPSSPTYMTQIECLPKHLPFARDMLAHTPFNFFWDHVFWYLGFLGFYRIEVLRIKTCYRLVWFLQIDV